MLVDVLNSKRKMRIINQSGELVGNGLERAELRPRLEQERRFLLK
jgi:hypothetical protein